MVAKSMVVATRMTPDPHPRRIDRAPPFCNPHRSPDQEHLGERRTAFLKGAAAQGRVEPTLLRTAPLDHVADVGSQID